MTLPTGRRYGAHPNQEDHQVANSTGKGEQQQSGHLSTGRSGKIADSGRAPGPVPMHRAMKLGDFSKATSNAPFGEGSISKTPSVKDAY